MNRQSIAAVLFVAACTSAAGVEPGFPASEPFERIHVRGPATLEIRQGRSPQVAVTAVDRVLADVAMDVSDIHGWGYVGPNHAAPRASPQRR